MSPVKNSDIEHQKGESEQASVLVLCRSSATVSSQKSLNILVAVIVAEEYRCVF